jgi:hypothetical protein
MATKALIVFKCDTCGKEERVINGQNEKPIADALEAAGLIEFEVKQTMPRPRRPVTTRVHYHRVKCVPAGLAILVENEGETTPTA